MACRVERRPLVAIWSLRKYEVSPQNKGEIEFPEFIGVMHPFCWEHRAALDIVAAGTEYTPEENAVCPKRPDDLTEAQHAYLKKWRLEEQEMKK